MISVIVPVYNVEKQLPRCIQSLKRVAGDSVEIILVDDGSTDGSGSIVDAINDPSFRVFHTENHGLSAARNYGIEQARGDWLMFVDSDDWVEPEFCKTPLLNAEKYHADLVAFGVRSWKRGKEIGSSPWRKMSKRIKKVLNADTPERPVGIVTQEDAVQFGGAAVWNKLYRRELFDCVRYPEGRFFEDLATTHKLIYLAQRIVLIPDLLYNYDYRAESISKSKTERNKKDAFLSAQERFAFLNAHGCPVEKHQGILWNRAIAYMALATEFDEVERQAEMVMDSIPGYPEELSIEKRIMLLIWRIDKRLFHFIFRAFGMK